jgi:hypothetical protein
MGIININLKPPQVQKHTRLRINNTSALPCLVYGCETWVIREQKSGITSIEMRFMRRTAKYTWQDYKTNKDILSELIINPVVKKIHMYRNKWIQHVQQMDRINHT